MKDLGNGSYLLEPGESLVGDDGIGGIISYPETIRVKKEGPLLKIFGASAIITKRAESIEDLLPITGDYIE